MLAELADVVDAATDAFDQFHYTRALERTEAFFWSFCDDYLELVKGRAYGSRGDAPAQSAQAALSIALSTLLRLFAPDRPVRHRGGLVVVAGGLGPPRAVARRGDELRAVAGDADRARPRRRGRRARRRSARPSPTPSARCGPRSPGSRSPTPATRLAALRQRPGRRDGRRPGRRAGRVRSRRVPRRRGPRGRLTVPDWACPAGPTSRKARASRRAALAGRGSPPRRRRGRTAGPRRSRRSSPAAW